MISPVGTDNDTTLTVGYGWEDSGLLRLQASTHNRSKALKAGNEAGLIFEMVVDFTEALRVLPEDRAQWRILRLLEEAL